MVMDKIKLKRQIKFKYDSLTCFVRLKQLNYSWFINWLADRTPYKKAQEVCEDGFGEIDETIEIIRAGDSSSMKNQKEKLKE